MKKLVIIAVIFTVAGSASGGSIWARRDLNSRSLYTDDVARQTGDILTVIISEDSRVNNTSSRDLQKTTDRSSAFDGEVGLTTPNHNILPRIPGFSLDQQSSQQMSGQADFQDQRRIADRITVVVHDVLPNGNLVVLGSRSREVVGDTQIIQVSGIVRPSDIAFDNTVRSAQVADFQIVAKTQGLSEPYRNPGWFGRILDVVWPF
ncbi:MAG TPA: flagellar basal body L-ring protein FlgH [Sedimentisphaerales bacterium]|nr:flagellar basal body L-ring protein FlgH [Sedimentisphaerales bacterium]